MLNKFFRISLWAAVLMIGLSSCSDQTTEAETAGISERTSLARLGERSNKSGEESNQGDDADESYAEDMCIKFQYPITLILQDNQERTVANDEELDAALASGFEEDHCPEIKFPITVTKMDGTTATVSSDEQLATLFEECWGAEDYAEGEEMVEEEDCFEIQYPVTIQVPGGEAVAVNNVEEEFNLLDKFMDDNPESEESPEYVFPITVIKKDGTTATVSSDEELDALYEECSVTDDYPEEGEEIVQEEDCFEIQYPVTLQIPGGEAVTVNNEEEEYTLIDKYFSDNPEANDAPEYVYPITVVKKDKSSVELATAEALDALLVECYGEFDADLNE